MENNRNLSVTITAFIGIGAILVGSATLYRITKHLSKHSSKINTFAQIPIPTVSQSGAVDQEDLGLQEDLDAIDSDLKSIDASTSAQAGNDSQN